MKFSRELMKGTTPFIILKAIQRLKETYGYELIKNIQKQSNDTFNFPDSTLYPILYRLEEKGWIQSEIKEVGTKKPRRYYRLTKKGLSYLSTQEKEMKIYIKGLSHFLPGQTFA